jgi:hypothetical protein
MVAAEFYRDVFAIAVALHVAMQFEHNFNYQPGRCMMRRALAFLTITAIERPKMLTLR